MIYNTYTIRKVRNETSCGDAVLQLFVHGDINEMRFGKIGSSISHMTQLVKKVWFIANPDVLSLLDEKISGNFVLDDEQDFALLEEGNDKPTKVENLSMGMKFFVLLKYMLLKGVLQDRDVLILDEPENHLHPTWQIVYAKVLVLLQKKFNLTILLTSHSAFFVNAVQRFSLQALPSENIHFYLSKEDPEHPGFVTFEDRSGGTGPIFKGFNEAYALVDALSDGGEIDDSNLSE